MDNYTETKSDICKKNPAASNDEQEETTKDATYINTDFIVEETKEPKKMETPAKPQVVPEKPVDKQDISSTKSIQSTTPATEADPSNTKDSSAKPQVKVDSSSTTSITKDCIIKEAITEKSKVSEKEEIECQKEVEKATGKTESNKKEKTKSPDKDVKKEESSGGGGFFKRFWK